MHKIFLFLLLLAQIQAIGQQSTDGDTVEIHHTYYRSLYIKSKHVPVVVDYNLSDTMLVCDKHLPRGRFDNDPDYPEETDLDNDYAKSGYDRGHLMNAKDNDCSLKGMKECFYFSNMFPQVHALNAGAWLQLESYERDLAKRAGKIHVFIGGLGNKGTIGKTHQISVPTHCWKVIYVPDSGTYQAYIFPNEINPQKLKFPAFKVPLAEVQSKSGMTFQKESVYINHTSLKDYQAHGASAPSPKKAVAHHIAKPHSH